MQRPYAQKMQIFFLGTGHLSADSLHGDVLCINLDRTGINPAFSSEERSLSAVPEIALV
jgi:hypothetical protein